MLTVGEKKEVANYAFQHGVSNAVKVPKFMSFGCKGLEPKELDPGRFTAG